MTNKEAITTLNLMRSSYSDLHIKRIRLACDIAMKAIIKQIPKKPINPCGRYFGKAKGGNCPVCGAGTNSITSNYCRKCGQALDWSEQK